MVRILFVLAAVVAAILAIVLDTTSLYAVAIVLLLSAIAVLVFFQQRQQRRGKQGGRRAVPGTGPESELSDLGILGIRPRATSAGEAGNAAPPGVQAATALSSQEAQTSGPPAYRQGGSGDVHPASVRVRRGSPQGKNEPAVLASNSERVRKAVLLPCLQSLLAAVQGNTVCLLKQEGAGSRYRIEAVASQDANARLRGYFNARAPFLTTLPEEVTVSSIGEGGLPEEHLGYYHEPAADVRQVAWTPLPGFKEPHYVLLADTQREIGFRVEEPALLADFAALLAALLEAGEGKAEDDGPDRDGADETEPPRVEAAAETAAARPRREIIAEEMEHAQAHDRSLAFALVYLNRAEALADAGEEAVADAEAALERRLRSETPEGRVERFGELTYGVFLETDAAQAEAWAARVQDQLAQEAGALEGGVAIGMALLGERHHSPDALRSDATKALQAAYQTGTSTILE